MNGFWMRSLSLALVCLCFTAGVWAQEFRALPVAENTTDTEFEFEEVDLDDLLDLSLEELSQTRVLAPALEQVVSTVSRQESTVGRSAAAVFVVTQDMIRRSGARTLPEVLRVVPGVQVARIDANKWAVTIRGFNGRFTNKLLVQIDGRNVYTPLFGGTYWDAQDIMLEDVERIEVIRGPGATVWGANAVNGVINILTKHSRDTVGGLVTSGAGSEERGFASGRVGGYLTDNLTWRAYGKYADRDRGYTGPLSTVPSTNTFAPTPFPRPAGQVSDDWRQGRGGLRLDWTPTCADEVTVQGDFYNGTSGIRQLLPSTVDPPAPPLTPLPGVPFVGVNDFEERINGQNALLRWKHDLSDESDFVIQSYYDRTKRRTFSYNEQRETVDIDFQHRFPLGCRHNMIWGAAYQTSRDEIDSFGPELTFTPGIRTLDVISAFLQDEIEVIDDQLFFTVGSKFESNDFTGFEYQPSARVVWLPNEREAYWGAISKAVRRPTRVDDDISILVLDRLFSPAGMHTMLTGNRGFVSEDLMAYELGYRSQPTEWFSWDIAVFYNDYNNLETAVLTGFPPTMLMLDNQQDGQSYGLELAANYRINECWRLYGNYSFQNVNIEVPPVLGSPPPRDEGTVPKHQAYLWLSGDICCDYELDLMLRYVDAIDFSGTPIPSYIELDARLGWQATDTLELAVVGRNLLDTHHPEFIGEPFAGDIGTEVQRSVYGVVTWEY
jgi:iron complex outermembrane receptor protein